MNKQNSFGNVVMVLKVLAFFILLVLSHQTVTEFNEINQITGFAIMESGFENTILNENSTQELIEELPEQ